MLVDFLTFIYFCFSLFILFKNEVGVTFHIQLIALF